MVTKYQNRLTVVIPTHNSSQRLKYIERCLKYYSSFPCDVIICDSSMNALETSKFPENIRYIHLPGESFVEKMLLTFDQIESEFIACCADDDFIVFDALKSAMLKMVDNEGISATVGRYCGFSKPFDNSFSPIYQRKKWRYVEGDNLENVYSFMSNYHIILWGLYRKDQLLKAYQAVSMAKIKNDNFIEFILGITLSYSGEIAFYDDIWGVRELNSEDSWGRRHIPIYDISQKDLNGEHLAVRQALSFFVSSSAYVRGYEGYIRFGKQFSNLKVRVINKIVSVVRRFIDTPCRHQVLKHISAIIVESERLEKQ